MSAGVPENDVAGSVLIVIDSLAARVDPRCAQSLGLRRIVSQLSLSQFMADITSDSGVVVPTHALNAINRRRWNCSALQCR